MVVYQDEGNGLVLSSSDTGAAVGFFLQNAAISGNADAPAPTYNANFTQISAADDPSGGAPETTTLTAWFFCGNTGSATISVTQGAGSGTATPVTVNCIGAAAITATAGTPATVTGTCTSATQSITANTGGTFAASGTNTTSGGGLTASCTNAGTFSISFTCNANVAVTFSLGGTNLTAPLTCAIGGGAPTFSPPNPAPGTLVVVTATCTAAGQALTASAIGFAITPAPANGTFVSGQQINCNGAGTMTSYFTCPYSVTVTFTLNGLTGYLTCTGIGGGVAGGLLVSPPAGTQATVSGQCFAGQSLTATGSGYFTTASVGGIPVLTAGGLSATCSTDGYISATFVCSATASTVFFYLGTSTGTLACSGGLLNTGIGLPLVNTTTGVASTLTVTASPQSVSCNGTSTLSIAVRDANGNSVANGATVLLTSTGGNLSPSQTQTSNGSASATLLAPSSSGNVTVSAASGVAINSTSINVTCNTTAPVVPPQIQTLAPRVSTGTISPPNTGDAGLAAW